MLVTFPNVRHAFVTVLLVGQNQILILLENQYWLLTRVVRLPYPVQDDYFLTSF